jgi:hypothetical protein
MSFWEGVNGFLGTFWEVFVEVLAAGGVICL